MPTAPNASIYRACVDLYLFLFFPPRGGAKLACGESTKNCQPGPWPLIARPCCCCCRSLAMPHAQRLTTSEQRPGRWPTCVDEGRVGHNPARTYGAIAVELRVFPPLILSLNLSHRVLPLSWAFHIFHQNFTRDEESRHWVRQPCFRPAQLLAPPRCSAGGSAT